ncbi:hypothetical protein BFP72_00990 [Reichenbachiella sp. 5M10]|uniref:DUF1697 domain-containing protein n=1 Tax=Reichenbachiella sp. 5M10 TaxID=1889772 RepID=UPI000C147ECA|nr:DUF1697 domain-containing protein [Reichenbachiella sp. 5M10]PIB34099.1 hypothetical protein BFP72_00990 [Reichenbachiella sp. 5M10]
MKKYVALLRGINVSGQKKIKMAELKAALEAAGLQAVQTYIQSGNVVFESEQSAAACSTCIEQVIREQWAYEVPTLVVEQERLPGIISDNPYVERGEETRKLYFCFLYEQPSSDRIQVLADADLKGDEYVLRGDVLYLCYHQGAGKTKMDNKFVESKLQVSATSRNWNTTCKLSEM